MENSKVNSQDLVESAVGRNDDVFNVINFPDSHIFSLQRFAEISLSQEGESATTTLLTNGTTDKLGDILTPYTLGRSTDTTKLSVNPLQTAATDITVGGANLYIAPISENGGTYTISDTSYKLTPYFTGVTNGKSDVTIALAYNDLPTVTGGAGANYYIGVFASATFVSNDTEYVIDDVRNQEGSETYAAANYTAPHERNSSDLHLAHAAAGYIYPAGTYRDITKIVNAARQGYVLKNVATSTNVNLSFDFYDVSLSNSSLASSVTTGTYVYKNTTGVVDFKDNTIINFTDLDKDETEKYKINGVTVALTGSADNSTATFTVAALKSSDTQQVFSSFGFDSNVSIAFTLDGLGSNTGVSLNGITYKSNNNSGTVTFSASGTSNFITLGKGDFALESVMTNGTTYNLDSKTTGTFTVGATGNGAFILDVDGSATGFAPVTFSSTSGGTVIAQYGDSNITLSGTFSIDGANSTTQLGFTLSDGSVATINGLTFKDADGDGSSTFVNFSSISDITIGGAFTSINSGTEATALTGLAFTLNDSTTAALGTFSASDTADVKASKVIFDEDSNTFTLAGAMSVSGTFTNATFTLSDVGVYKINGADYEVASGNAGISDANKLTFINDTVKADAFAHLNTSSFVADVTGFSAGDHITYSSGTAVTIDANSAQLLKGYYFGNSSDASGTVQFSSTGIVLTGNLIASKASDTQLIGLNGESFTATAGSFFVQDTGTVKINTLTFTDASDGFVSELNYSAKDSSMGVFGAFTLSGSDTDLTYTLNGFNGSNSSIVMSGIKFEGTGTSVQNTAANQYSLGASNSAVFNITSKDDITASSFTLLEDAVGVFNFGGLGIDATGSALTSAVEVGIAAGTLSADSSVATVMIAGSEVAINDAGKLNPYRITLNDGKVDTIYNIDGGASITALADANTMITSSSGTFLFNNSSTLGTGTQIFKINGDNEVTFTISSGTVVAIAGIDANTQIDFTDTVKGTSGTKTANWNKTYKLSDVITRNANGTWGLDKYIAYIANYSDTFKITGIDENGVHYSEITSNYFGNTGTTLSVLESVFDSATQVVFQNTSENAYSAQFSGTTGTPTTIFSDLSTTGAGFGVMFESGETMALSFASVPGEGTATSITELSQIGSELSLTLANYALNAYDGYNVSGTGVGVSVISNTGVTVSANDNTAVVGMPGNALITFSTTGTYNINGLTTQTLTIDATKGTAVGTNTDVFTLALAGGAVLSDTFTGSASSLKVNDIVYSLVGDSATFVYSTKNGASDTLAVGTGFLTTDAESGTNFFGMTLDAASTAGFALASYTYTGVGAATNGFTLSVLNDGSQTQLASVGSGAIKEAVADGSNFVFEIKDGETHTYTALTDGVIFNVGKDSTTFVSGTGTRELDAANPLTLTGGSNSELTGTVFNFTSGSIALTFDTTNTDTNAKENISAGVGVFTGTSFTISDYYLRDGENDTRSDTKVYNYKVNNGETATITWTIDATNGIGASNTMTLNTGFGATRSSTSTADATFALGKETSAITYTSTSASLSFFLNAESAEGIGAAGIIWTGSGTRPFATGDLPANITTSTRVLDYNGDMYSPSEGALLTLSMLEGAGTETFTSGSGTYTAAANTGVFHFNGNAYTATSAVTLGAYFSDTGTLFSATGTGERHGSGTYVALSIDSFTMAETATLTLDFDNGGGLNASETFTAGSGTASFEAGKNFALNDVWFNGGADTTTYVYKAETGSAVTLAISLNSSATGTISITEGFGTRTETMTAPTFIYNGITYSTTNLNTAYTFGIGSTTGTLSIYNVDSASGMVYTGKGYKEFVSGTDVLDTVLKFNSDTYTFSGGQINLDLNAGSATFTAGAGSATFTAYASTSAEGLAGSETTFHFAIGTDEAKLYTATALTTLNAIVSSTGEISSLYDATGAGTRLSDGTGTYVATALNNDSYTMAAGSTLLMTITGVGSGTEVFSAGTGTLKGTSFTLNDKWLAGGDSTTETLYTYYTAAGSSATLTLNLTDSETGTISITEGFGTYTTSLTVDDTFNYSGTSYTVATGKTEFTFGIGSSGTYAVQSASGLIYSGFGYKTYESASDSSKLTSFALNYNSDTFNTFLDGGRLNLTLTTGTAVFSAGAGSATFTANSGKEFHFASDGGTTGALTYTATGDSGVTLYGIVNDSGTAITRLYGATGAGTFTGATGTHVVLGIDTFTMDSDATRTLTFSENANDLLFTETYTAGAGYMTATGTSFALNEYYFTGGASGTASVAGFTYTASGETVLSLNFGDKGTETVKVFSGMGTRDDENATSFTYLTNSYTKVGDAALVYAIDSDAKTYEGDLYTAVGTRAFELGSDTFKVVHLTDSYTAVAGTLQLTIANGDASTDVTGGTATYTADTTGDNKTFHFVYGGETYNYTATTGTTLQVSFEGTNTKMFAASGAGTRPIETATTFVLSALNNDSYTFTAGATALLSISDVSTYNETAYAGTGSGTFENTTFYAAFDASGNYSSLTAFTYTASGTAVLTATLENGSTTGQAIISGVGYRNDTSTDTTFTYEYDGTKHLYSATSVASPGTANLKFVLNSDTAKTYGAFGEFYSGVGYRNGASDTYTPDGGQEYTLDKDAEWQLTVTDGANASETLYTANTSLDFNEKDTFTFKGTTYTVDTTTAVLSLTATKGEITEALASGTAIFNGTSSDTTFTYDTNEYNVVGSATLRLTAGKTEPDFVSGKGQKEMAASATGTLKTFKYTDGNTYTVTSDYALLTAIGNSGTAVVNFETGTAVDNLAKDQTFYYALDHSTNTLLYTANEGGATLGITGTTEATAYAEFIDGSGYRTQNSATGLTFTFDNNVYTSTGSTFTWTLSYDEDAKKAVENVTGGEGTRTLTTGTFTYISPDDKATHTYTVQSGSDVTLAIAMVGGNATETMTAGAATRDMASGTTFAFAPNELFLQSATFTATAAGTYQLKAVGTATEGMETLGQTDYNANSVTETILSVTATGTYKDFAYNSIVTNQSETYKSSAGVNFTLTIDGDTNTVTWDSGSATMKLAADRTFGYTADNATSSHTYTVDTEGATFTRTSQTVEYLSAGIGYRALESGSDIFNVTYLSDTYTADAGRINLSASGTTAYESFNSGTATFALTDGGAFHFNFNGKTNEYNVTESGTLQVNVENGSATTLFAASGAGTRAQNASDTAQVYILDDIYNVSSGTYKLSLGTAAVGDESETLIGGAGVFTTTDKFHVSDFYLGNGTDTASYEYTALNNSEVQLALTIDGDSNTIKLTSGIGTRDYDSATFKFTVGGTEYNYTNSGTSITNAISADSQTSAAGYIYTAVGTREGADTNTTFYFHEDLYRAQSGTMQLTVTKGVGAEDMISGTAEYVANSGDAFHYDYSATGVVRAYTATTQTTLTTTFTDGTGTAVFASIVGEGTRTASETDVANFSYVFESDTYKAVAGSATIKLDATTANIFETLSAGAVVDEVAVGNEFHYNGLAYNAQSATTIEHTIGETTKNFTANPYGTRTATDTTFNINSHDYTLNSGESETYLLSGTGTNLVDSLYTANGYRTDVQNETYTSLWNNTYSLSSGTYTIAVTGGEGTETLTTASAELAVTAGGSVYYSDSSTSYTANIDGATLNFTVANGAETETLTAGAISNASGTYLVASGNFTVGAGNATLTAPTADSSTLVTVTAGDAITAASASLTGAFASGNLLNVNDKFIVADNAATLNIYDVNNVAAASGLFVAKGDFTGGNFVIDSGTVKVDADTDISVAFDTSAINAINNLTDGVTVKDAAGATKAFTDSTGTFKFDNTAGQTFTIDTDNEVTFQIDSNGIVTNIAGLNYNGTEIKISITDGSWSSDLTVTETGKVLTRNALDGSWIAGDVDAVAYVVEVATDSSVLVSAIDANSNTTKIDSSKLGTSTTSTGAINFSINSTVDVAATPVYVENSATDTVVNVTNYVTGIGNTAENMAVRVDSTDSNVVNVYKVSATTFDSVAGYTIANGTFSVGTAGEVTVATAGSATASVITNDDKAVVGLKDDGAFAVNEGPAVTIATGADDDSTTANVYTTQLNGTTLSGLTPSGVETGTVKLDSSKDADTTTTFKINDASVSVTNDNDSDGITLEIQDNALVGVNNVSTDATINASGADKLAINGDTDNVLTDTSLPVKFNTTDNKWISGDAPAKDANGYLVTVDSAGTVHLAYTTSTQTDTKVTTNKNDYATAFSGNLTLEADGGTLPTYGDAIAINSGLGSTVGVSVVTAYGEGINITDSTDTKALTLVTANGKFSVNGQEIIPSAAVNVTAISGGAQVALTSDTTITHTGMNFTASSDTSATFAINAITLNDTAKVTSTSSDQNFVVNGTVSFDGIAVKGNNAVVNTVTSTVAPSGLTVNGKDLLVTGGDLNYTVDVSTDTAVISGITSAATVAGALVAGAVVQTDATGTYKIGASNDFTIMGDSAVDFAVGSDSIVTGISGVGSDTVTGSVIGDFTNSITVNGKTVLVSGDELVSVSANGSQVTQIDGVGGGETVSVANAGGATLVNTDATGNFYFGDGTVNSQLFIVGDDAAVGFRTSSLSGDVPSVVGVTNFDEGTLEIAQSVTAFTINNENAINLANDSSAVNATLDVGSSVITAVHGLTGSVSGLSTGVAVEAVDSDVTINGAQLSVSEVESLNVVASAVSGTGYDVVTGLNTNATVNVAANVSVKTEEAGVFTFVDDIFTITGDPSVTFVTDGNSRVKNVADFAGTLTSTESDITVNGAAISMTNTDASITAAAGNVTISGLADSDSVTVPTGAVVEMPGTTTDNTDTTITINGKTYGLEGDGNGVAIKVGSPNDSISGLDAGARLTVGAAGNYNVNGSALTASIGAVIVGDAEGAAHIASAEDITFDSDTTTDEVVNKIINGNAEESTDKYVEHVTDTSKAAAMLAEGGSALDGNLDMVIGSTDTADAQTADFTSSKGIKKVTMSGNNEQNIKFNDEGGNVAIIGAGVEGEKNVSLGAGGDLAVVEKTDTPVNITAGKGRDTIVSQGRNTSVNISAGGPTRLMATAGNLNVTGYDHKTGAGVQLTNSDVARAVQRNAIQLGNGSIGVNGATVNLNLGNEEVGSSIVNFYNLKGKMTKVGFTHSSGGTVNLAEEKTDVVMKGNYSGANDQDDNARAGKKDGGSTLIGGSGNDSAFGGAGDRINLGNGDNYVAIDNKRTNSDSGATIEQTSTSGRTVIDGFNNNDFSDMGDRVRISTSASVKFVKGVLTFVFGGAQLILNGVTSAISNSGDLAESADIVNNDYSFARTMIEDEQGNLIKAAIAEDGKWIQVTSANAEDYMANAYIGENSGIDFATYDGNVNLTLADGDSVGTGVIGGTSVNVRGISKIQLGLNDSTVIGAANTNNTIAAGEGNASMWGGGASNDTLIGNTLHSASNDFFYFDGNGRDVIQDFEFITADNHSTADRLNILNSGLSDALASGTDLVVEFGNVEDRLTIKDGLGKDIVVERGAFGGSYDTLVAQVNTNTLNYDGQANYFYAIGKNATVSVSSELYNAEINIGDRGAFDGDIKVINASAVQGTTTLMGNNNDNSILGSSENSSMWGGAIGNDTLVGGAGVNTFFYGKNNGNDVATNVDDNDIVNLYDVELDDIVVTSETGGEMISSNAVTIALKDSAGGGTLTVQTSANGTGFRMANGQTYIADHQSRTWSVK